MTARSRRRPLALALALALSAGLLGAAPLPAVGQESPSEAPFLVGAGSAAMTIEPGTCLGGYGSFCNRPAAGTKDPLHSSAVSITGGGGSGETVIIAKTTAVGLFAAYKEEQGQTGIYDIRQRIAARTGVPADHVVVTSDHSHAAPDTIGIWGGVTRAVMERMADSVVDAAAAAHADRRPARMFAAAVTGPGLDSSYSQPPTNDEAMDEEFRAFFAETSDGEAIATLVNYAPHATVCGKCGDEASGDWTAWAADEVAQQGLGLGIGFVGALGSTDWGTTPPHDDKNESEARSRLDGLLAQAVAQRREVSGDDVKADVVFIREKLMQPVLAANAVPAGVLRCPFADTGACDDGDVRIDRDIRPPWLTGSKIGTYVGALRIGDVFLSTIPGEPFPQIQDALRAGVQGASVHFMLGAANDFLGYMVADRDQYEQTLREGATFLPGCPEEEAQAAAGADHDGACPDHWTLMVSPTMGTHAVCTAQDAAVRLGFTAGPRADECTALTALDGQAAPPEHTGEAEPEGDTVRAGVARVEASWHLGASGGQFSDTEPPFNETTVDPHMHSTKKKPAYGLGSRVDVRALVVEGSNGEKVAIVSHDLYLPNDFLTRRIATLVERATGIPASNVMVTASHNHNSAFYSTPSWGTWIFQDVFDLRFYEYMAEKGAEAVQKANDRMVPARVGGGTSMFNEITSHTYGPKVADDGTPAGQPYDHTTGELTVVAFDDLSDPDDPAPLATWVVFGVHPEWTWGYDLLNGDISHATMRITDRELGGTTVWSGREIGASGPHKDTRAHGWEERREFQDNGFAAMDRAARMLANAIADTRSAVAQGDDSELRHLAPFRSSFEVDAVSKRFAPPATRPHPGVSNCNTASLFHGDPRIPVLGLPDCARARDLPGEPTGALGPLDDATEAIGDEVITPAAEAYAEHTAPMYDQLKQAGVPIPESYSGTKLSAVEETAAVHLMAIKLGDIGITVCPCEQFTDTALNIQSRIDRKEGIYVGFSWTDLQTPAGRDWCIRNADETWTCANPQNPNQDLPPIDDITYRRFVAQIFNDAKGWEIDDLDDPESDVRTLGAEAEPYEPEKIKGNFTHEEFPDHGYALPISVGMGNDYWGYVPEYREMRSHDHYRKALNGLGPHGADFLATRLARLAVSLNDGPGVPLRALDVAYEAESARAQVMADGLGELADAYEKAYRPTLPADGGQPAIVSAPDTVELFDAFNVSWIGGSTYADMPEVTIQRKVDGEWRRFGDTAGEVQLMVDFPNPEQVPDWRSGNHEWLWTATFEAFGSDVVLPDAQGEPRRATPPGDYRAVITGQRRTGEPQPPEDCEAATNQRCRIDSLETYELVKDFTVVPWDGMVARDLQVADGEVSFEVASEPERLCGNKQGRAELGEPGPIDLPDGYESSFPFIRCEWRNYGPAEQRQSYCSFCSFRPWADTSRVAEATVTIRRADGTEETVAASKSPDGRWHAAVDVYEGDTAVVDRGDVVDEFGNVNGTPSNEQAGTKPRPTTTPTEPDEPAATVLDYDGDSSGQYSDQTLLRARLTDASGDPLAGRELTFELTGAGSERSFAATTDDDGVARVTPTLSEKPGPKQLTVRFAGTDDHLGSADVAVFVVDQEDTALDLTAAGRGKDAALDVHLYDADSAGNGVGDALIDFFADGEPIGSATTGPGGRATLSLPPRYRGGKHSFEAVFDGDDFYRGSTGQTAS